MDDRRAAHNALVLCVAMQQNCPVAFLTGEPPVQHSPPSTASQWHSNPTLQGHVGIEVDERAPFHVVAINRLMDLEGSYQGEPGYSNQAVQPGDTLLQV